MNIKEYMCPYEECIKLVKEGINRYTKEEMYSLINNHGYSSSISKMIRHRFCCSNVDEYGTVYLYDELNPLKITEYFFEMGYQIKEDVLYAYVCQVLMGKINAFYKELDIYKKEGNLVLTVGNHDTISMKKYFKLYLKAVEKRIDTGYKRIRRK